MTTTTEQLTILQSTNLVDLNQSSSSSSTTTTNDIMVAEHLSNLDDIRSSPSMAIISTALATKSPSTTPTSPFFRTNLISISNQNSLNQMEDQYHHHHHQQQQQQQQGWFLRRRQSEQLMESSSSSKRSHEEDVYEDLCYVTLRSNCNRDSNNLAINLNSTNSNSLITSKRDYCLKELIETEKNYCEALQMIIDHFCQPLIRVIPVKHRNVIFSNLQSLSELHWKLYQDLYRTNQNGQQQHQQQHRSNNNHNNNNGQLIPGYPSNCSSPSVSTCSTSSTSSGHPIQQLIKNGTISACFLSMRDRFLNYGQYCANLPKAQQLLDELCVQDPVIEHWVSRCQEDANQGRFKLRDLLSLPMQRILKYHLLLGELIRNTNDQHDDFEGLRHSYDMMLDIGAYINEMKRDTETLEIINDLQRSIIDLSMPDDYELKDYGRLIKDGEVRMRGPCTQDGDNVVGGIINGHHVGNCGSYGSRMTTRLKNRYIFIFDKVMLMCKTIRNLQRIQYSYKDCIVLEEYKLEDMSTCSPISKLTKNWSSGWSLIHCRTKQPYTFFVKNEEIKRKWMEAIERAQDNVRPRQLNQTDHHLALATVLPATCCVSCHKLLKGTWFQGYQCYVCNVAVHKSCITTVRSCAQMMHERQSSIDMNQSSPSNANHDHQHHNVTMLNSNCPEPPTPSRNKQRILAKAISTHFVHGQLPMEPNDTIVVYSTNGPLSFGLNLRLGEEGSFPTACITELMADSPSNASSSNIDSPTCSSVFRFCYDDQTVHHQTNDSSTTTSTMTQTLPRKLHQSNWIMPTSPLAVSTPALNKEDIFFPNNDNKTTITTNKSNQSMNPALVQDGNLRLFFGNGYNLEEYAWFAGSMDRDTAQTTLNPLPNGSFLVRISPKQRNSYAISINYKGLVKHMRVQVTYMNGIQPTTIFDSNVQTNQQQQQQRQQQHNLERPDKPTHFYLSERRYFRTIVDLVRWYELNSLAESFNMVNTQLLLPYKKAYCHEILGDAVALYAFTGTSSAASSFLSLRKGDRITVLSRAAEDKGWWKGQIGDRLGYFPFKYVKPTTYSLKRWFELKTTTNQDQQQQQQYQQPQSSQRLLDSSMIQHHRQDDSFGAMTTSTQMTDVSSPTTTTTTTTNNTVNENKQMPSPSSSSSASSSETSSPITLSSPVNSDRDSPPSSSSNLLHSRQASSDAGIGDIGGDLATNCIF
nr:protein vav-1-like [Dermatophagoides farinae]